jgi:type I restriction-modification system DNA methylase subunit
MSNIFNSSSIFNSKEDLKDYIHDIHNFIRNNGAGYGKTGMKIFNIFYGLKLIEPHLDSLKIDDDDKKILKFSNLIKKAKKKDSEITEYIDEKILDVLADFKNKPNLVVIGKLLFHEIPKKLKDDFWCELINQINVIPVGYYEKDNESKVNLSGKVYEYFIGRDKSAISELGAFFTDRWITEFLIDKVNPTVDENNDIPTIIDPFAGSGGFTLGVANYFREHFKNIDWKDNVNNIFHFDMDEDVINMSGLEMFAITSNLPKIDDSNYKRVNSFAHEFDNKKYNYIFTNPPYGGDKIIESASQIKKKAIIQHMKSTIKTEELKDNEQYSKLCKEVKDYKTNTERKVTLSSCSNRIKSFAKKYNLNSNDKEGCSLILLMDLLSENGTCCAVLKEGVFFDNSYADIRKVLIENFNITNIISIPSDAFESTTTKTSAIIFKNNGKTKKIKFSELLANKAKSNIIEKDENEIYSMKYLKDEIIDVYENELSTVTFEELIVPTIIKKYDNVEKEYYDVERYDYSLNCKDYNKPF